MSSSHDEKALWVGAMGDQAVATLGDADWVGGISHTWMKVTLMELNTRRYYDFTHWAFVQKLLSSPGGMSDVESILTPFRDRPRMAGSYGVSLNDPKYSL